MTLAAHQIATRAIGGTVSVAVIRDPGEGALRYAVAYQNQGGGQPWLCRQRFLDVTQADAGCLVLADFLGAAVVVRS